MTTWRGAFCEGASSVFAGAAEGAGSGVLSQPRTDRVQASRRGTAFAGRFDRKRLMEGAYSEKAPGTNGPQGFRPARVEVKSLRNKGAKARYFAQ